MWMGSSSKVKAKGFSLRKRKILVVLELAKLNATIEENLSEYFRHSTSRCDLDWNGWKHVHPHGSCGKKRCWYLPVGACPETNLVNQLKVTISPASVMNCLPFPSQALGSISLCRFFNCNDFVAAKPAQAERHSWMTSAQLWHILEAMLWAGKGRGPMIAIPGSWSALSLMSKPKWLGIHRNLIELSCDRLSQSPTYLQLFRESSKAEWGFILNSDFNVDWLSM